MKRIAVLALFALHASLAVADESAQELVTKAVARSRAIRSGSFEFPLSADKKIQHNFAPGFYVAPVLGYAVPLVEHYTDGQLRERYTATDFSEKAPGIFLASHIRQEIAREKDTTLVLDNCHFNDFEVRAEFVNAMLPDNALSFVIPAGFRVDDRINNTFFKLRDDTDARDLLKLGRKAAKRPQKQQKVPIGLTD